MAPIRVAIIGLSASAKTSWAQQAHLPYLTSERGRSHYKIVALLNSSVIAAETARDYFDLPATTRVYGSPQDLAEDEEVDFVLCTTRADVHMATALPSALAGKALYIEWPLTENLATSQQLLQACAENGILGIVGLQSRVSPVTLKIREILLAGRIGSVLSSDVRSYISPPPRDMLPEGLSYFADRKVGGNQVTIKFGHLLDQLHHVLGEWAEDWTSRMQIQRPQRRLYTKKTNTGAVVDEGKPKFIRSDVPDLMAAHGRLVGRKGSNQVPLDPDATLSVMLRAGQPFKGQPTLTWTINGSKGEMLVSSSPANPGITIQVHGHATDSVEDVEWKYPEWQKDLSPHARLVAEMYDRYASWVEKGGGEVIEGKEWPTIADAVNRMTEMDTLWTRFDEQE